MTLTVEKIGKEWAAVVWMDTGSDLYEGQYGPGPWTSVQGPGGKWEPQYLHPTIQVQPHIALKYHSTNISQNIRPEGKLIQSSSLIPLNYGRSLDEKVAAKDPFYAVSELFTFCAFSESQFLNMLESKLSAATDADILSKKALELSNLQYMQKAVKLHGERIENSIETIRARGGAFWPKSNGDKSSDKVEAVALVLSKQYEHLLRRAKSLSTRIEDQTRSLTNKAMIDEAKRARDQAVEVTKLTQLAFFYIPLSFVSSFFGMNLDPLTEARNSLWWFFAISVPILGLSMSLMFWDVSGLVHQMRLKMRRG
ncbi:Mg2+ transporter protein CorA-like/Zinc transport protein ZntB [Lasiodiplodia theobromae]|uniref:Mg2+ transporter protein CorA-like/Zinc transport protein ZntB n=1 Tax=Lasiodiplodia theobromae TaxID=45133 RepID=UPI0015C32E41|nr:Mg2+ transporter protein CorA-like/Zinc transport protein ZntB [Lasiodiplodia theobromae]KAF4539976.1 Mg2+ transporter protein CorA-like/Zinc transport protein ZntB [Lasiodiplodia theobromae]